MNPIVEDRPYPAFIEEEDVLMGVRSIGLRIGNPKPGETRKTIMTLTQARLLGPTNAEADKRRFCSG